MATYNITVVVEYDYEYETFTEDPNEALDEAENEGWNYENYAHSATVSSIYVDKVEEDEDKEEESE